MAMVNQLTIFYTDDDQEDLDFFKEIVDIIDENLTVVTHNYGHKLLKAIDTPPPTPHVDFLDINIPGINGFETLKRVKQSDVNSNVPIVIFSIPSDESTIQKSRELGAGFYMPKSGIIRSVKKSIEHTLKINWNTFIPEKNNFVYNS